MKIFSVILFCVPMMAQAASTGSLNLRGIVKARANVFLTTTSSNTVTFTEDSNTPYTLTAQSSDHNHTITFTIAAI